jgi:hypothetical protein
MQLDGKHPTPGPRERQAQGSFAGPEVDDDVARPDR